MKNNLVTNLRASVFALSAASLAVTVPAFAQNSVNQAGNNNSPQFTELDQNNDRKLNQEELQSFAEDKQEDAEQFLSRFDRNNDDALDRNEFAQLSREGQSEAQNRMTGMQNEQSRGQQASAEQADEPDGPKVVVDQKPTQINVEKPPAQVTIDQPKPKVTITTQDPKVEVEQSEPRVSVQQSEPQVSVDQAQPDVEVQDADPEVQVSRSEPRVNVNEQEPEVNYESADNQQQNAQANRQANNREQQSMERETMAARTEQQSQRGNSGQSAAAGEEIYTRPISELRSAEVVDQQGETLGNVAEVVVKRDSSEAGFIISTAGTDGEQRHVYRAAEDFSLEGDEIVFTEEPETLTEPQGFMAQDFVAAPGDEQRSLSDLINREGLSAR